jgi:MYXO-CTERM domain-containing protein
MAIRALGALATAAILSTASSSWGQEAPDAADDATGSDATLGDDAAADQDTAPGDEDGGADDSGDAAFPDVPGVPSIPAIPSNSSVPSYPVVGPTVTTGPSGTSDQANIPQGSDNEPTPVDDGSPAEAGPEVGPSWGDAAPAAEQVQGLLRPDDGCGGCSTGDTGNSGPLVVTLAALVAAWRSRRRG